MNSPARLLDASLLITKGSAAFLLSTPQDVSDTSRWVGKIVLLFTSLPGNARASIR